MMRILHLSDIHYRIKYPIPQNSYDRIFEQMTSPLTLLKNSSAHLWASGKAVDAVLLSGDLTEDGNSEDYRALKNALQEVFPGTPIIAALGNHDCKSAFYEGWLQQKNTAPYHHVVSFPELQIIVLDNADPERFPNGRITEDTCIWLKKKLEEAGEKPVLLMMHHQVINADVVPPCSYPPQFTALVERKNVLGICCGHTHHYCKGMIAEKPYYIAGSMSFIGLSNEKKAEVQFRERYGYNYYVIEDSRIKSEEMVSFDTGKELGNVVF